MPLLEFQNLFKKTRRLAIREFISQFSRCPLVWIYRSRTLNNKINKLHERALRLVTTFAYNLIKNLRKNHETRLESTSFQSKTHLQKNLFLPRENIQGKT